MVEAIWPKRVGKVGHTVSQRQQAPEEAALSKCRSITKILTDQTTQSEQKKKICPIKGTRIVMI